LATSDTRLSLPDHTMPSFNPFSSNATANAHRNTLRSNRPPTYTSRATAVSGTHDRSERVRAWSENLPGSSGEASQHSDTVFGQPESSLPDTVNIGETPAEMTRPPGPRYSRCSYYPYHYSLDVIKFPQFTTERTQRMGQFHRKTPSTPMIHI
jgi:hypothetical protein